MKILFLGVYRDGTGYGNAAIDTILAIDSVGIDVAILPIKLNKHSGPLPERILELENKSPRGADFVIQHTLPAMMEYSGKFKKNIAMYCSETSNFSSSNWANKLNLMDICWVPSQQMVEAAKASGVKTSVKKINYPTDISKFEKSYKKIPAIAENDSFKFYTIGELGKRKNFPAIIRAFHSEFEPDENVDLVIKTYKQGISGGECIKHVEADCNAIKELLKIHPKLNYYKREIIIGDDLDNETINRLHNTCDCFVSSSFGEAWGIPAFDAMGFGKTPIVTNWGGFKEFVSDETGWLVDYQEQPVFGITDGLEDLYTGRESWAEISIQHLRRCMREAYENHALRYKKSELGISRINDFSYQKIGLLIKKELESYEREKESL